MELIITKLPFLKMVKKGDKYTRKVTVIL